MNLTASRHHKRSIALMMLVVWMFALLSGVANACLTEPRGEPAHAATHTSPTQHPTSAAVQPHAADQAQHGEHSDKAPCQKSCDASSQTLLKQLPKVDTPDLQAPVPAAHRHVNNLDKAPPSCDCACWKRSMACGSLISSGVT